MKRRTAGRLAPALSNDVQAKKPFWTEVSGRAFLAVPVTVADAFTVVTLVEWSDRKLKIVTPTLPRDDGTEAKWLTFDGELEDAIREAVIGAVSDMYKPLPEEEGELA